MVELLAGIPGVVNHIDDIAVFGPDTPTHDVSLRQVMDKLGEGGVILNDKCVFHASEIVWVGYRVSGKGVLPDPEKVRAIVEMRAPTNKSEVKTLMAKTEFLRKFVSHMADVTGPITDLLKERCEFVWDTHQKIAFEQLKQLLTHAPVLVLYDARMEHRVASDASAYGLGALLEQSEGPTWKPVAYKSRGLTSAETRYAVIEKEALGILWACIKFREYILGKEFTVVTDHKPLVAILGDRHLDEIASPRLQRIRLRLTCYQFNIVHVAGKDMHMPDLLSRCPLPYEQGEDEALVQELEEQAAGVMMASPVSDTVREQVRKAQGEDAAMQAIIGYLQSGFPPGRGALQPGVRQYWNVRHDLWCVDGLLMYKDRLVVPESMQQTMLLKLHEAHLGATKMRLRAQQAVYWPGMSKQVAQMVEGCKTCCKFRVNRVEPLLPSEPAQYPWQRVAMDLAEYHGKYYLVMVDAYSRFIEVF